MVRILTALVLAIGAAFAAPALAQDKTYANAKDAYLEGWFQETAQRDLQSALAAYRACVAKGDDRELAAKAMLRMALIARALGDEDAAKAQLDQIDAKYADTAAGSSAKELREAKEAAAPAGAADLAVAEMRGRLEAMFADPERATPGAVEDAFRVLGAKDFLDVATRTGKYSGYVVLRLMNQGRVELLTELALAKDSAAHDVVRTMSDNGPVLQFAGRLFPLLDRPEIELSVARLLATQTDAESLRRLTELLPKKSPEIAQAVLWRLDDNPASGAAECVDVAIGVLMSAAERGNWADLLYTPANVDKPSARAVIARYAKAPLKLRAALVGIFSLGRAWNNKTLDAASDPLFQQMLVDPEPWIRRTAIERLISDPVDAIADDGVRRLFAEAPPWNVDAIESRLSAKTTGPSFDALFSVPSGAAREWAYQRALFARNPERVLSTGLDRGDPELLSAFFDPREFVQNAQFTRQGRPIDKSNVPCQETPIRAALAALQDDALLVRLARGAATHPRASLRLAAVRMFLELSSERDLTKAVLEFGNDALPAVRKVVASAPLSTDLLERFAVDPSVEVAMLAIAQIKEFAAIQRLARTVPLDRANFVLRRALEVHDNDAMSTLMMREGIDEQIVTEAFVALAKRDSTAYVNALTVVGRAARGGAPRDQLKPVVIEQLRVLALDSQSKALQDIHRQFESAKDTAALDAAVKALQGAADEVERAWRAQRRESLMESARTEGRNGQVLMAEPIGKNLALVADRAWLVSKMSELPGTVPSTAAAWALATLGARAELVAVLDDPSAAASLKWLVGPLLASGARDEVLAATFDGRLPADAVWQAFLSAQDFVGAARLRYAPPERHIVMVIMDMSEQTQTALVAALEAAGDVETLLRAVSLDGFPSIVRALLRMGQSEALFAGLPSFPDQVAGNIAGTLEKLTRAPRVDSNVQWPQFAEQRAEQIASWRAALTTK